MRLLNKPGDNIDTIRGPGPISGFSAGWSQAGYESHNRRSSQRLNKYNFQGKPSVGCKISRFASNNLSKNFYFMKFEAGESVIVLDTENRPAGTGHVISFDEGGLYRIAFTYINTEKKEEIILPEHRLLSNRDVSDPELRIA